MKNEREIAIKWWRNLHNYKMISIRNKFMPKRNINSLTGREIEWIWRKENQI